MEIKSIPKAQSDFKFILMIILLFGFSAFFFWLTLADNRPFYTSIFFSFGLLILPLTIYIIIDKINNGYGTLVISDDEVKIIYSNSSKNIRFTFDQIQSMDTYHSIRNSKSGISHSYSESCILLTNGEKYIFNEAEEENYLQLRAAINKGIQAYQNQ